VPSDFFVATDALGVSLVAPSPLLAISVFLMQNDQLNSAQM
jgi:hypothetical protein